MPSTPIKKTDLLQRYRALRELFELTLPDQQQREKLLQNLCPERSGSNRQKALQYAYAANYAVKSSSQKTEQVKALARAASGTNGVM